MKPPAVIVLEALLSGQKVRFRTGHEVELVNGQLYIVAADARIPAREILLHAGGLDSLTELFRSSSALSKDELAVLSAQTGLLNLHKEREEERRKTRERWQEAYTRMKQESGCGECGGTGIGPTPRRGAPPGCATCQGTGQGVLADDAC